MTSLPFHIAEDDWIAGDAGLVDVGGPVRDYPADAARVLAEEGGIAALEMMAARFPDRIVVDDGRLALSYAEFIDRVYGLAARLAARWPKGAAIASLTHNSSASPIIIMASAMAGLILVPIDAGHPAERRQAIFRQSGAVGLIFVEGEDADDGTLPSDLPRVMLDPRAATGAGRPDVRYDPAAPLFVSFTSGSTGNPKGVAAGGLYGSLSLAQFNTRYRLNQDDVVLGLASLSVGGARDAFVALAAGAKLRICDVRSGFGEILRVMAVEGVTILSFVPSALRAIMATPGIEASFRTLRVLDLHGERILASDIALFRTRLPADCAISITMGSIEAGAVFSWFVDDARIENATAPVGYLLPGRRVAVVDDAGAAVRTGEVGELIARGWMALGAWREGRIVPGPFLPDPQDPMSRIYRMGDLVRRRDDGLFEYVGRKDRQVKIRGLWADLGEVEAAIRAIDGVADTAVIVARGAGEGDRIVAFLAMADGAAALSLGQVARAVAARTAGHMAPSEIRTVSAIPRLANFKADLQRLEAMVSGDQAVSG